jgi:two-component system, probable response regulator PhcQ
MKTSIVYLDDETGCLALFSEVFGDGYDIRTATTPEEAHRLLAARPADIVISDQTMPRANGKAFLAEIAAGYPSTYRVLLTGNLTVADAMREVGAGVVHAFVTKPWGLGDIYRVLERGLVDEMLQGM